MSEGELNKNTSFLRPLILGKMQAYEDDELQKELYAITADEASEDGWLSGPYSPEEVTRMCGQKWLHVRRFGIKHKGKIRPIDNFKESKLNETFGSFEKIELKAMECVLWSLSVITKYVKFLGEVEFKLSDGTVLAGSVRPIWKQQQFKMRLTCVGLKSAYKQLPLRPCEYHGIVVSLWDPDKRTTACFFMRTLPFGEACVIS